MITSNVGTLDKSKCFKVVNFGVLGIQYEQFVSSNYAEGLGPCPFCSSDPKITLWYQETYKQDESLMSCQVYCFECHTSGPTGKDHKEAAERWNLRSKSHSPATRKRGVYNSRVKSRV